jgi:hypothetical protein
MALEKEGKFTSAAKWESKSTSAWWTRYTQLLHHQVRVSLKIQGSGAWHTSPQGDEGRGGGWLRVESMAQISAGTGTHQAEQAQMRVDTLLNSRTTRLLQPPASRTEPTRTGAAEQGHSLFG